MPQEIETRKSRMNLSFSTKITQISTNFQDFNPQTIAQKSQTRTLFLASLGSILEYYDFVVYGMLVSFLKAAFFPSHDDTTATLQFFSVFAMGYIARPFGGMLAGIIGDRFGRKPVFLSLAGLMAISTLTIGLLPSYAEIGRSATLLLILCRLIQGLSFGGELPGALILVGEFSFLKGLGFRLSFVVASAALGAVFASFMLFGLTTAFSTEAMTHWGWRIPFLVGGILGMLVFWARQNIAETPLFLSENDRDSIKLGTQKTSGILNPQYKKEIRDHFSMIISGIFLTIFLAAMIIGNLYFPYYIHHYFEYSEQSIYLATTISLVFSAFILPLAGRFSDKWTSKRVLKVTGCIYAISSVFIFQLLSLQSMSSLIIFMLTHQLFIALISSSYYSFMIKAFPTRIRYTGIAICYNLCFGLMGSFPGLLTFLSSYFHTHIIMPLLLSMTALISVMSLFWIKVQEQ